MLKFLIAITLGLLAVYIITFVMLFLAVKMNKLINLKLWKNLN